MMKRWLIDLKAEYQFYVQPKWQFILTTLLYLSFMNALLYYMWTSDRSVMNGDVFFLVLIILMNPLLAFANYKEYVNKGYRKWKIQSMKEFEKKLLDATEKHTLKEVYEKLPHYRKGLFIECLFDSEWRNIVKENQNADEESDR